MASLDEVLVQVLRNQMRMLRIMVFNGRDETEITLEECNKIINETNDMIEDIER